MTKEEAKRILKDFLNKKKVVRGELVEAFIVAGLEAEYYEMCRQDGIPDTIDEELVDIFNELSDRLDRAIPQINKEN